MKKLAVTCLLLLATSELAHGYETQTHAFIVSEALKRSTLEDPTAGPALLARVGLDRLDSSRPFGLYWLFTAPDYVNAPLSAVGPEYYDNLASNSANQTYARSPQNYEQAQMTSLLDVKRIPVGAVNSKGAPYIAPIRNWLMRGAIREDDLIAPSDYGKNQPLDQIPDADPRGDFRRPYDHFYDPVNDKRLHFPIGGGIDVDCPDFPGSGGFCYTSVDWAMGTLSTFGGTPVENTNRRNHFTWWDARNNYFWALTQQGTAADGATPAAQRQVAAANRMRRWATVFRSLGDVLHLLGDASQPQHTRNDPHTPSIFIDTAAQQAYEPYINARVLRTTDITAVDGYGADYIRSFFGGSGAISAPNFNLTSFGQYPIPQFRQPQDFFSTRYYDSTVSSRRGMADYSNKGFFTAGTLPPNDSYALPATPLDAAHGYTPITINCTDLPDTLQGQMSQCQEYLASVPDALNPTGYSDPVPSEYQIYGGQKIPLATQSEWDEVSNDLGLVHPVLLVMRLKNFQVQSDFLFPRAIAYSAGLLNYFFRGSIQVDPPQDGLFGLVDHSLPHTLNADGYPICNTTVAGLSGEPNFCTQNAIYGFTKIRLKIRNNTPAITESGPGTSVAQLMQTTVASPGPTDAQIVAVARYHRNLCYQPTLLGEATVDYLNNINENTCGGNYRSKYQEISVSAPAAIDASILNGSTSSPVTFDFSNDPIPINATDLFIQVVYRGHLGDEPSGVAVGMIDVREPSYVTLWNNSDYAGCNGGWVQSGCGLDPIGRGIVNAYICIGGQSVYQRFANQAGSNILLGHHVRLAALLDDQWRTTKATLAVGSFPYTQVLIHKSIKGQARQASMEQESASAPYVPDPMFIKRGMIGSFRPIPYYLISGTDPQPGSDMGTGDVGSLSPAFTTSVPDTGGVMNFPNTPLAPLPGCSN